MVGYGGLTLLATYLILIVLASETALTNATDSDAEAAFGYMTQEVGGLLAIVGQLCFVWSREYDTWVKGQVSEANKYPVPLALRALLFRF